MAKVVLDANVIISAAFLGKPLEAVVRALEDHEVYLSLTIERELQEVISGLSKKLTKEQILFIGEKFEQLLSLAKRISVSTDVVLSRDPKDDHYLSLCKEAGAVERGGVKSLRAVAEIEFMLRQAQHDRKSHMISKYHRSP